MIKEFEKREKNEQKGKVKLDGKNALQEYVQKHKLGSINYETLSKIGPDHSPEFRVAVLLNGTRVAEGKGQNKKTAEAVAAVEALRRIKKQGGNQK